MGGGGGGGGVRREGFTDSIPPPVQSRPRDWCPDHVYPHELQGGALAALLRGGGVQTPWNASGSGPEVPQTDCLPVGRERHRPNEGGASHHTHRLQDGRRCMWAVPKGWCHG